MTGAGQDVSDERGLRLGTPCQNEHTINRGGGGDLDHFWITCGDEVLDEARFADMTTEPDTRQWSQWVMARHEIKCWKDLARDARDELDRWGHGDMHYGNTPRDPKVLAMVDRINAALREGPYGHG